MVGAKDPTVGLYDGLGYRPMSDQTRPNGQARQGEDRVQPDVKAGPGGDQTGPDAQTETRRRVTVREAARILNTTVEGVRSRIKRGSLDSMRVEGTVYVLLTPDQADRVRPDDWARQGSDPADLGDQAQPDPSLHRLVDEQREMIDWLKREVERKDTILMQMARRIPELEPPREASPEATETHVTAPDVRGNGTTRGGDEDAQKAPWWKRFFGFE